MLDLFYLQFPKQKASKEEVLLQKSELPKEIISETAKRLGLQVSYHQSFANCIELILALIYSKYNDLKIQRNF